MKRPRRSIPFGAASCSQGDQSSPQPRLQVAAVLPEPLRAVASLHLHLGRTIDRLDYPSPDLRRINSELPGVANFRGYTSTLQTEGQLYNFTFRDSSLCSKANYLLKHEERRTQQKTKYNMVGALFIPNLRIGWQGVCQNSSVLFRVSLCVTEKKFQITTTGSGKSCYFKGKAHTA